MTDDEDQIARGTPAGARPPVRAGTPVPVPAPAPGGEGDVPATVGAFGSGAPEPAFDADAATLPVGSMPAPGGERAGELSLWPADRERYEFGEEIARGGMGRIIAARDRRLGRAVAIKELLDHSPPMRRRFEREALITARLRHPATISILETGSWPTGELFYVMDLVEGQSLDKAIAARATPEERFGLIANVLAVVDAIAYAHNLRIIHRDLKPANVLCGEFGETVVIDWGLAKDLGDASADPDISLTPHPTTEPVATQAGLVIGTPSYMPPEQADGQLVDERADVYALGAILYHVLAGRPPYTGRTAAAVLVQVLAGPPSPLATIAPETPPELITIVGKAMARAPGDRYRSARDLAADLKRFQTGQLVGSHAYTAGELVRRWLRRHRAAVAVAGVAALVLAAIAVFAVRRIVREQHRAEEQRALAVARGADAEELMGFMLGDLRDKLKPLGKLELLDAVATKAVAYYDKRADGEDDLQTSQRARALQNLGDVQLSKAAMPGALAAYRDAAALWERLVAKDPASAAAAFGLASSHGQMATVLITQGDATNAVAAYRRALTGLEAAAAKEPGVLARQLTLAMTHRELGDALVELGDGTAAIAEFRAAIAIAAVQGAKAPDDARWQRMQAVGHSQLGGALLAQGDAKGALAEHRADVAISERLAAASPKDTQLQSDVAAGHSRIGDVLRATGDNQGALPEFRTALGIAQRLADKDPANADWQHDLAISRDRVGNVLLDLGDKAGAFAEYRAGMDLKRRLTEKDPSNLASRRNLAIGHNKVGNVMEARGDKAGALAEYSAGMVILEGLTAQDPANAGWQRDLAVGYYLVAEMLLAQGDAAAALTRHRASLAIVERLAALDPKNTIWEGDVVDGYTQVGKTLAALRRPAEALPAYQKALELARRLAAKDPSNRAWADQVTALAAAVKTCCVAAPKR